MNEVKYYCQKRDNKNGVGCVKWAWENIVLTTGIICNDFGQSSIAAEAAI
jgi:hypothetical protein